MKISWKESYGRVVRGNCNALKDGFQNHQHLFRHSVPYWTKLSLTVIPWEHDFYIDPYKPGRFIKGKKWV